MSEPFKKNKPVSRRNFIKSTSIAAGGFMIVPVMYWVVDSLHRAIN